jgi:hypothetical protein
MIGTCKVDGCDERVGARGLCRGHYAKWWSRGDPLWKPTPRTPKPRPPCLVTDCPSLVDGHGAKGMCGKHYKRWSALQPRGEPVGIVVTSCSVSGCTGDHAGGLGMCKFHYQRFHRTGTVEASARVSKGGVDARGYRYVYAVDHPNAGGNGQILEHRLLVAGFLGRPLQRDEEVHHRNGQRAENTVGPCLLSSSCTCAERHNLELWSKVQPGGQRVADKIAWAKELLRLYEPSALA